MMDPARTTCSFLVKKILSMFLSTGLFQETVLGFQGLVGYMAQYRLYNMKYTFECECEDGK